MRCLSHFALAGLLVAGVAGAMPADAAPEHSYEAISSALHRAVHQTGATGAALLIGEGGTIAYVETAGKARLTTPVNVPARADLGQATLILALVDTGFLGLDDPAANYLTLDSGDPLAKTTIRQLLAQRAVGNAKSAQAATTLMLIAESATARSWHALFKNWIATPLSMNATSYPEAPGLSAALDRMTPTGTARTTARDYARLAELYVSGGRSDGAEILSPRMLATAFRPRTVSANACSAKSCNLIEESATGIYAWVDRSRGLYGVMTAPGAEMPLASIGRQVRHEAEAIYDREHAGAGLTSAVRTAH
jgi:CubicO group peptidase (beta-lactamase class C family)